MDGAPCCSLVSPFLGYFCCHCNLQNSGWNERSVRVVLSSIESYRVVSVAVCWCMVPSSSSPQPKYLYFASSCVLVRLVWFLLLDNSTCWEWKERYYVNHGWRLLGIAPFWFDSCCVAFSTAPYCIVASESCIKLVMWRKVFLLLYLNFVWGSFPRYFLF